MGIKERAQEYLDFPFSADGVAVVTDLLAEVERLTKGRELECVECKTLEQIDTGRSGYEQGLERAAVIAETMLAKKSYRSVGITIAAAIRAEV